MTEERVFAIGALLLLGGVGRLLVALGGVRRIHRGLFWHASGTDTRDRIARDLGYLQHPLIALLLVVAGAPGAAVGDMAGLALAYLVCRTAGKLIGGWIASLTSSPRGTSRSWPVADVPRRCRHRVRAECRAGPR